MRRGLIGGLVVGALALAAPAVASADTTYCVPSAAIAGCPASGVGETSITNAMSAVNGNTGAHDRILIGAKGTPYVEDIPANGASHRVDIMGAGTDQTVIQAVAGNSKTTLSLMEPTSTVSNVTLRLADGNTNIGLSLGGSAQGIAVTAGSTDATGVGVSLAGGTSSVLSQSTVSLPFSATISSTGVTGAGSVQDSTISAGTGASGVSVLRTRLSATTGVSNGIGLTAVTFDDDLIVTAPSSGPEQAVAISSPVIGGPGGSATVRHLTAIGDGSSGSIGVGVNSFSIVGASAASATIDSSIIRGFAHALSASATGGFSSGSASSAMVSIDYSDFDPTTDQRTASNGTCGDNTCPGTATISEGLHDVNVAPQFANTTAGDPLSFHLLATSPLLYNGNPTLGGGESTTDLDGKPRVVMRSGSNVTGMGAFQHQPTAPTVSAAANPTMALVGVPIMFSGSASDPNPGDTLTLTWAFDDGATATGPAATHAFATPGHHMATLTARDLDNLTGAASAAVTVVAALTPGVISNESLVPQSFPAAPSGGPVQTARAKPKRKYGTLISYLDSQPGITTFTVQRPTAGRVSGRSCVKQGKKKRKGKRCTLYANIGSFTHADVAGANRFRFTGRINGHKLRPGSYRLQAVTANTAGKGTPVFKPFRIIR